MPLRVAAISFLNPAPLLFDFEHEPGRTEFRTRYDVHYTLPSRCAAELHAGGADLGLIPIAELTPELAVVPGCTIASLYEVRSIVLLLRSRGQKSRHAALQAIRSIAADNASRSSAAYVRVLLQKFLGVTPQLEEHVPDVRTMLAAHDAALLIGDHALLAREQRSVIDAEFTVTEGAPLLWIDVAQLWREYTGLPWVAAVWAVRPGSVATSGLTPARLVGDLNRSRDAGLAHVEQLVTEWAARLPLPPAIIRTYLTENIHYRLDGPCIEALRMFRALAADLDILPPLPELRLIRG